MTTREVKIKIHCEQMPGKVRAALIEPKPGCYQIFLNAGLSDQEQAAGFLHECLHIYHGDTAEPVGAGTIEERRHNELKQLLSFLLTEE